MKKKIAADKKPTGATQIDEFVRTARALECDESEEAFEKALGKIGKAAPAPIPAAKSRKRPKSSA